jgi:uncharacterized protein (TIGR03083 family)
MAAARRESGPVLLERFREITAARAAGFDALSDAALAAETWTPVGPGTVERLMRLRLFDCWMHEQDIRDALARPGHEVGTPVEVTLDLITGALGYVLARQAQVSDGGVVTLVATGPATRTWHVVIEGQGRVVDAAPRDPDTTLRMPTGVLTRLCGGRVDPAATMSLVEIDGDLELGRRIVENLAFTR